MEHGFWDYTCQAAGGMEFYGEDDYRLLFDDMQAAGMDSVVIVVRWFTAGYRSKLGYMKPIGPNPVIDSDNDLLRFAIAEAQKRGIKVRLGACVMSFDAEAFGGTPTQFFRPDIPGFEGYACGLYDTDHPGVAEQAALIFAEMFELFGQVDGYMVELENTGIEAPHRLPLYNKWAEENGRQPIGRIGRPYNPRVFDLVDWRDYATHSRLNVLKGIETSVQSAGFAGDIGMICETAATDYAIGQEVNLKHYHEAMPDWFAVTYEYNKAWHRYAMMDFCIAEPKRHGLKTFYLPRGVMTWTSSTARAQKGPLPIPLEENWRLDVEDIKQFQPDGVWWFGSGTKSDGLHVSETMLKEMGYADGVAARRALLGVVEQLR